MTHIFERVVLRCAYPKARRFMHDDAVALAPAIPPFVLHLERTDDPLRFEERLRVRWHPKDGALLPRFTGEIILYADADLGAAVLELTGRYTPPLGAQGRAFDLFVGSKIASATAKMLLRKMAEAIEHDAAA